MSLSSKALAFATTLMTLACGEVKRPDGGAGLLPVGSAAPNVSGKDETGAVATLTNATGGAVVYFYPKDDTPGCTKEACAFRDSFSRYRDAGITVFGVSRDSEESHKAFREKHKLQFALVSDETGAIQRAYGVPSMMGMASRVTFLVGKDGKIVKVWPNVDPGVHADEVLAAAGVTK